MPELPEVETMCRRIAAAAGCRISGVHKPRSRLQPIDISPLWPRFKKLIAGRKITAVSRLGKRIVLELDANSGPLPKGKETVAGDCIVVEPRMTGIVLPADPPDEKHLRLVFELTGGRAEQIMFWDQRGLGVVRFLSRKEFDQLYGPDRIGPDALKIDAETLQKRLAASRRSIKVALLDQRSLAGIGNLYASEILHLSGVHPATPCCKICVETWRKIVAAMRKVLQAAIRCKGSTLGDGTYRIARNRRGNYQLHHRVYQRADKQCPSCNRAKIVRIVQAQRSTFFCPICQKQM